MRQKSVPICKLSDFAYEVRETYEPKPDEEIPYIGLEHIEKDSLQLIGIGTSSETQSTKKVFKSGDILFGSLRPYFRKVYMPKFSGVCSTDITVIRAKENADQRFVKYLISNKDFIDYATNCSNGTRMPRANWKVISQSKWYLPPLPTQRKIAAILSAYDDLIENNNRRIRILEEMAQLIYREWFVKFRFPGHEKVRMVDSELGPIPEGWEVKRLGDICDIVMGQSPNSKHYNTRGEGLPFHQGVSNFNSRYPTHEVYCTIDKRKAHTGDILFSVRAPVGRINIADRELVIGRGLAAIRHKLGLQSFLFYQLKAIFKEEDLIGNGAIFNSITKQDLFNIKVIVPTNGVDHNFNSSIESVDQLILNLTRKNTILRRTRDLLLPKLISGELDVEDLDIAVEGD